VDSPAKKDSEGEGSPRSAPQVRRPGRSAFGARSPRVFSQLLVAPGRLLLLFLVGFPAAVAIYISVTAWSPTSGHAWYQAYRDFTSYGLNNYWEAISGSEFWAAIWRTVLITVLAVGVEFALGFALALLFLKEFRGRTLLTLVFLLPMMVVPAVTGFIFYMLFQTQGPVNDALTAVFHDFLHLTGTVQIPWLSDPSIAIFPVIMADIWQWTPLMFLIFLSGLAALPEDQMNQAQILGASFWFRLRHLILPMMKPIILIALIIRAMEVFKLFDAAWLLTQGGPGDATTTVSVLLYRETFINARWGYSSAVAILILIFISVLAIRAIRPIEAAQEETLEELMVADAPAEAVRLEDAIEAELTV
jgi:multiple sugar transport system permease protein